MVFCLRYSAALNKAFLFKRKMRRKLFLFICSQIQSDSKPMFNLLIIFTPLLSSNLIISHNPPPTSPSFYQIHQRDKPSRSFTASLNTITTSTSSTMDILCVYCFDVLNSELEKRSPIPFPAAHLAKTNPKLLTNGEAETNDVVSIDTD